MYPLGSYPQPQCTHTNFFLFSSQLYRYVFIYLSNFFSPTNKLQNPQWTKKYFTVLYVCTCESTDKIKKYMKKETILRNRVWFRFKQFHSCLTFTPCFLFFSFCFHFQSVLQKLMWMNLVRSIIKIWNIMNTFIHIWISKLASTRHWDWEWVEYFYLFSQ